MVPVVRALGEVGGADQEPGSHLTLGEQRLRVHQARLVGDEAERKAIPVRVPEGEQPAKDLRHIEALAVDGDDDATPAPSLEQRLD